MEWLGSFWELCNQIVGVVREYQQGLKPALLGASYAVFSVLLFKANNKGFIPLPRVPEGEEAWEEQVKQKREEAFKTFQQKVSYSTPYQLSEDTEGDLEEDLSWNWSVITTAPLSRNCVPDLRNKNTLRQLNAVIREVKHPYLHPVLDMEYVQDSDQVIITQLGQGASLRDLVYQEADPTRDWADKYLQSAETLPLPTSAAAAYGRQILLAANYLYRQGFPPLEHIQMGNIFVNPERRDSSTQEQEIEQVRGVELEGEGEGLVPEEQVPDTTDGSGAKNSEKAAEFDKKEEDPLPKVGGVTDEGTGERAEEAVRQGAKMKDTDLHCFLGGYESTLLGYRSRLYRSIAQAGLRGRIDVIMFGHVMYELLSGRELEGACPKEAEFEKIQDEIAQDVLRRLFDLDAEPSMHEILSWDFFSKAEPSRRVVEGGEEGVDLSSDLQEFLRDVYGGSGHSRAVTAGRGRNVVGKYLVKGYSWLTGHSRQKKL